jgi:hypothetical protein
VALSCSLWPVIAAIYAAVGVILWVISQKDGYVEIDQGIGSALAWMCTFVSDRSQQVLGGEFISSAPKVGWFQFFRNVFFWFLVIGMKVRTISGYHGILLCGSVAVPRGCHCHDDARNCFDIAVASDFDHHPSPRLHVHSPRGVCACQKV